MFLKCNVSETNNMDIIKDWSRKNARTRNIICVPAFL